MLGVAICHIAVDITLGFVAKLRETPSCTFDCGPPPSFDEGPHPSASKHLGLPEIDVYTKRLQAV